VLGHLHCSCQSVLSEVLAAIVHRLSEEYAKIELKSDDGKKRMMQDVALISSRLAPLSESGSSVASLETLVREKPTPRRPIGQAMRGMLNRVGSGSAPSTPTKEGLKADSELDTPRKSGDDEDGLIVEEPQDAAELTERETADEKGVEGANGHETITEATTDQGIDEENAQRPIGDTPGQLGAPEASSGETTEPAPSAAEHMASAPSSVDEKEEPRPPLPEKDQMGTGEEKKEIEPAVPAKE